ncbi:MAG: hypothetical protein KFH98_00565 [Gemmatimonadetes bacterium]|nr:hypothetical protein [Gemmatimonadota bacterium]
MEFDRDYPINALDFDIAAGRTTEDLLARRDELVRLVLELVPDEEKDAFKQVLTPPTTNLIASVPIEELATLLSEIYAIDEVLPPDAV